MVRRLNFLLVKILEHIRTFQGLFTTAGAQGCLAGILKAEIKLRVIVLSPCVPVLSSKSIFNPKLPIPWALYSPPWWRCLKQLKTAEKQRIHLCLVLFSFTISGFNLGSGRQAGGSG